MWEKKERPEKEGEALPKRNPSADIVRVETRLQAAIDGLFAAVTQVAQMVSLHPTPGKFLYEGSPLTSLLQIAASPASQHASTPL